MHKRATRHSRDQNGVLFHGRTGNQGAQPNEVHAIRASTIRRRRFTRKLFDNRGCTDAFGFRHSNGLFDGLRGWVGCTDQREIRDTGNCRLYRNLSKGYWGYGFGPGELTESFATGSRGGCQVLLRPRRKAERNLICDGRASNPEPEVYLTAFAG